MIDRARFAAGIALLAGCFRHEPGAAVIRAYWATLSPRLDDSEFNLAIERAIAEERFWPSPAVLLSKVGRDATTAAQQALADVLRQVRGFGGHLHFPAGEWDGFDAPTRAGIRAAGGLGPLTRGETPDVHRRFAAAYSAALNPPRGLDVGRALPPGAGDAGRYPSARRMPRRGADPERIAALITPHVLPDADHQAANGAHAATTSHGDDR